MYTAQFFFIIIYKETGALETERDSLQKEVKELREQKEITTVTVREKVTECKQQKLQIGQLKKKVESLESALTMMVNTNDINLSYFSIALLCNLK